MSNNQAVKIEPVEKQIQVSLPREAAFTLFTEGMDKWWPLATHSIGEEQAQTCVFEGRADGRIYEIMEDGAEAEWGRVIAWQPHEQVVFEWYPGRTADTAQEVSVTFSDIPRGTLVELVHSGWEILGSDAQNTRAGYDLGWDYVLAHYIIKANS